MAMPSTARRSDPHSRGFHTDIDPPRSPRPLHQTSRPSTPRPSISPLSTASKAAKSSPIALPDLKMSEALADRGADDSNRLEADTADAVDLPDDRSSSLSEPDDEPDDDVLQNGIRQDMAAAEELVAQQSLEGNSEAETERLDQTPHRLRRHADSIGKTPSKLSLAATIDDDLSDPPSPLPTNPGAASSTSTMGTAGNKRKRSNSDDSSLTSADSDFDESPRKRSHASPEDEDAAAADEPDVEVNETTEGVAGDAGADEEHEAPAVSTKGGRGRKGKLKGKMKKETAKEPDPEPVDETAQVDEDQGEESAGKVAADLQHKTEASTLFEDVAKQFTAYKEKLYSERLAALNEELDMLAEGSCKHPEYLRQVACVDTRYAKQVTEVQAFYYYKNQTLRKSTLGERAQLHGQYFQHTRELREEVLSKLGDDWYNIQKERRQSNQANDEAYIYKFPTKRSVQLRQQAKYNQEVSVLSGIAKHVGFPAAPDILGAPPEQLEDDLKAMKINKRVQLPQQQQQQQQPQQQQQQQHQHHQQQQQPTNHNQVPYLPFGNTKMAQTSNQITEHERLAHEQFIEQNEWARPLGPIHTHGTPNLTHTADWAEPVTHHSTKHLNRNKPGGVHHESPYSTPMPQRRVPVEYSSAGTVAVTSDPVDPPSSVQAAPPTIERLHHHYQPGDTSPLSVSKPRQQPPNGAIELTGLGNGTREGGGGDASGGVGGFRNISGASTIDAPSERPLSSEKDHPPLRPGLGLSGSAPDASAPHSIFETSQLPRHGRPGTETAPDAYPSHPGFRPRDGAFGTPAPFGATPTTAAAATTTSTASATNGS